MKKLMTLILLIAMIINTRFVAYSLPITSGRFGEAIYIDNNDSIMLTNENIYIEVATGQVTSVYELTNVSDGDRNINMKFPGRITYKSGQVEEQIDISDINVYVDKNNIQIDREKIQGSEYDYWYVWNTTFKKNEIREIRVTYVSTWEKDSNEGIKTGFIRTKGGPWKGELKYSKITFDFNGLLDYYIVNSLDSGIYKIVDEKYIWEAKEYVPNEDLIFYMKPKLLESNILNVSYYGNDDALYGKKILIDIDTNYTSTQEEKDIKTKAAVDLKWRLENSKAEVCISTDLKEYEKSYSGQVKFDYIITLICDKSNNIEKNKSYIAYEKVQKGNEEKYRRSKEIVNKIIRCGIDAENINFTNLNTNNTNIFEDYGEIIISEAYDYEVPRVIISLGYVTDYKMRYKEYQEELAKIRLGLTVYEESIENINAEEELEKEEELYYKREEQKKHTGLSKFGVFVKYNLPTIIICLVIGAILGIVIFTTVIANEQRKNRERYAMWYKKIK